MARELFLEISNQIRTVFSRPPKKGELQKHRLETIFQLWSYYTDILHLHGEARIPFAATVWVFVLSDNILLHWRSWRRFLVNKSIVTDRLLQTHVHCEEDGDSVEESLRGLCTHEQAPSPW